MTNNSSSAAAGGARWKDAMRPSGRRRAERQERRKLLAREARSIRRQLKAAVRVNPDGPVLGRSRPVLEMAERSRGVANGGIGLVELVAARAGLAEEINARVQLLAQHRPYFESDHVFNIGFNILCGGTCLQDIELRRCDRAFLDGLAVESLPDPTTAGDFCRRFDPVSITALEGAFMAARHRVWAAQPVGFVSQTACIDIDATIVATTGETKEGIGLSYDKVWGYSCLVCSLANTKEPLHLALFGANRPSHEGAAELLDRSVTDCRAGGFADIRLRGDSDYSLTANFDRWSNDGIGFVFGYDAKQNLVTLADDQPGEHYRELVGLTETALAKQALAAQIDTGAVKPRARRANTKAEFVAEHGYKNVRTVGEDITEFSYKPGKCGRDYRMIAVRKDLNVTSDNVLFAAFRYFFYITNDTNMTADEIVAEARSRCNQENLHAQLKAARALKAPLDTLHANWAYMTMATLAWTLKAWTALLLPVSARWEQAHTSQRERLLRMELRTFCQSFIQIPAQIVRTGRQTRWRLLAWNPWLQTMFRLYDSL